MSAELNSYPTDPAELTIAQVALLSERVAELRQIELDAIKSMCAIVADLDSWKTELNQPQLEALSGPAIAGMRARIGRETIEQLLNPAQALLDRQAQR